MYNPDWQLSDFLVDLENVFGTKVRFVEEESEGTSVNIIFSLASWMRKNPDWLSNLKGIKILLEHDSYMNFVDDNQFKGFWSKLYENRAFDLLLCSGKEVTQKFLNGGVPCRWLPKGCSAYFFDYDNNMTGDICCLRPPFGGRRRRVSMKSPSRWDGLVPPHYKSRYEMLNVLAEYPRIKAIAAPYREWPGLMTNMSAICINDKTMGEPMAKHFECSALGCVPIRDRQDELFDLGYNETSMIAYNDLDDLRSILEYYFDNPEKLEPIQKNAVEATKDNTWVNRAEQAKDIIDSFVSSRKIL